TRSADGSSRTRRRAGAGGPAALAGRQARSYAFLLGDLAQCLQRPVIQHLGGVLAAAQQPADLVKSQPRMAERDGLALALGELGDPCHQRPILDPRSEEHTSELQS